MILEVVDLRIRPEQRAEFEAAVQRGLSTVISKARGYCKSQLHAGIDSADRYLLHIWWETLENHTVDFRQSPAFAEWRAIVGPFFASPPQVEHFNAVGG